MEGISNQPIVIDNGTGTLKAGFAGGDRPRVVFSSAVGRPKHVRIMPGGALEGVDLCVGKKLQEHRGAFRWSYPMEHGVVVDWQEMEQVWGHLYSRDNLNVPSEDHPVCPLEGGMGPENVICLIRDLQIHQVLLTEAPLNPLVNREKASEVLFESFNVPAIFLAPQVGWQKGGG
jgi:centractin